MGVQTGSGLMGLLDIIKARGAEATALQGNAEVLVRAAPDLVYRLVSDVTRMGDWSPECYRCRWLDGARAAAAGARFKGYNRRGWLRWSTTCRVTEAEAGRLFAFEVVPPLLGLQSRWRYVLEPAPEGTRLTESFQVLWYFRPVVNLLFRGPQRRRAQMELGVRQTLQRIKAAAEGG